MLEAGPLEMVDRSVALAEVWSRLHTSSDIMDSGGDRILDSFPTCDVGSNGRFPRRTSCQHNMM